MMDWNPDPQSLLTVSAGTGMGMPHLRPTWRAMYGASAELFHSGYKVYKVLYLMQQEKKSV